jgi:hypothetical protein
MHGELMERIIGYMATMWPKTSAQFTQFAQAGDYIGGIWGTAISVATLLIVLSTWNQTRRSARLSSITSILGEMLKTHDAIAGTGQHGFWSREGIPSILLREFNAIYRITKKVVHSDDVWSVNERIDIAYTFAFYGLHTNAVHALRSYGETDVMAVQTAASRLRSRVARYQKLFNGHQTVLPHYLRNLFSMYMLIDGSKISQTDKLNLAKIVRTKLSNYDQALLALNVLSHLGGEWERLRLVERYKPFANLPEAFFSFDSKFDMKARFPALEFEWEGRRSARPRYRVKAVGRLTIILAWYPRPSQ